MATNFAGPTRWVLGLDISSARAKGLESDVLEATSNQVRVARLRSSELRLLRKQASDGDHTRAAVLFHVEPKSVHAWSGGQIAVQLARLLGPVSAWRLLQLVGSDLMSGGASVESPSRRKLSRSLAGAAVTAGMLLTIGVNRKHAAAQELTQTDGNVAAVAALDLEPQGGIDPEGKKTKWTVEKPDNKVRRRMEDKWRGDELRAYHDWLEQHGYVPDNDGKPQYGVVRRNGDVAYKSVVEVWKENDRRCAIVLAIGGSDKTAWSGLIFQDRDGDLLRRLRVNDVLQVEEDDAAAARVVGCPDWMPCPDGCSVCTWACGGLVASGAAGDDLSYGGCLEGCVELGNPFASGACGVACIGLVALGQYVLATKGCPAACRQIGSC